MSVRTAWPTDLSDGERRVEPRPDVVTLAEIVDESPRWTGPDRETVRQGSIAALGMLATAVFFGGTTGLVLYWVLVRVLAYLT